MKYIVFIGNVAFLCFVALVLSVSVILVLPIIESLIHSVLGFLFDVAEGVRSLWR